MVSNEDKEKNVQGFMYSIFVIKNFLKAKLHVFAHTTFTPPNKFYTSTSLANA